MSSSKSQIPKSKIQSPDLEINRRNFPGTGNLELGTLLACATCGGAHSTSPLAQGMNWGIFTLMGFIVTVLAGIALFFVHIVRKEEAANPNPPPPDRPAEL
jgi:hypothetical protein